jgi:hypothetical protein
VDEKRVDQLARNLANRGTRRGLIGVLLALPLTRAFARLHAAEESARMDGGMTELTYWQLLDQLMRLGWFRVGPGAPRDGPPMTWGFREGPAMSIHPERLVWIPAHDELAAMQFLLRDLPRA